jgi:hypothetical protein
MDDVRFALRVLAKDRRFTVAAVVALALGIGANTTVFTFIKTALFKDLPFDEPRQLMALGRCSFPAPQVVWMFVRHTFVQLAIGLALGLGGALAVGRLLQGFLVRTAPRDPVTLTAVAALLVLVAVTASIVPARRAARVDPVVALRYE